MPTILILGATSDMAYAIARKFAEAKYDVQLAARKVEYLKPMVNDLEIRYGIKCSIYSFDAEAFNTHQSFYSGLNQKPDVAVCVFGYMNENDKVVADFNDTLRTINTNYTGAVSICNIIAEDFKARKSGTIVGISSVAGERGRQSNYIYGSAKAGFTAYLSGLRNKLYKYKVHVVTILPGFVYTKMTENLKLPKLLTAKPADVANDVFNAVKHKKDIVYSKWFWKWIMLIIKSIPESIFKKKGL
jgi:decaprenylphospho-beta-D-erythro-pentofuranosid-2-ulose 2-reductase